MIILIIEETCVETMTSVHMIASYEASLFVNIDIHIPTTQQWSLACPGNRWKKSCFLMASLA